MSSRPKPVFFKSAPSPGLSISPTRPLGAHPVPLTAPEPESVMKLGSRPAHHPRPKLETAANWSAYQVVSHQPPTTTIHRRKVSFQVGYNITPRTQVSASSPRISSITDLDPPKQAIGPASSAPTSDPGGSRQTKKARPRPGWLNRAADHRPEPRIGPQRRMSRRPPHGLAHTAADRRVGDGLGVGSSEGGGGGMGWGSAAV